MPIQQIAKLNNFGAGFITEAPPTNFPDQACLDINNFDINTDGSLQRRLGMSTVFGSDAYTTVDSTAPRRLAVTAYKWDVAGLGFSYDHLTVVQLGRRLRIINVRFGPVSDIVLYDEQIVSSATPLVEFSYSHIGDLLIVATGRRSVHKFRLTASGTIAASVGTLKVRDIFGVEDVMETAPFYDLRRGNYVNYRPEFTLPTGSTAFNAPGKHIYNLRNQGWHHKYKDGNREDLIDPIRIFYTGEFVVTPPYTSELPSNADLLGHALFPDANDGEDRVGDRLWRDAMINKPASSGHAPQGHFIIDLFYRGSSRRTEIGRMQDENNYAATGFVIDPGELPYDATSAGVRVCGTYAGRAWYAGFKGVVEDGDRHSPNLSAYIAFSKLVLSGDDVTDCYQEADPTSPEDSDLVDTDGGLIKLDGVDDIVALQAMGESLLVIATNGVWMINGGSDYGFSATNYKVAKISNIGALSRRSVIATPSGIFYWGDGGIYVIGTDQAGGVAVQSITDASIKSYYGHLTLAQKRSAIAHYDRCEGCIRWIIETPPPVGSQIQPLPTYELVFDLLTGAFSKNIISRKVPTSYIGAIVGRTPYKAPYQLPNAGEIEHQSALTKTRDTMYLYVQLRGGSDTIFDQGFCMYSNQDFVDWPSDSSQDAKATVITAYSGLGDDLRVKRLPYIVAHFIRTENGFELDGEDDLHPTNPSSCIMQAQWGWANSAEANKWGREFQAYRYRRVYMPTDVNDPFDTGDRIITTKNKVRGLGKVVSIKITTEPGHDCRPLGWSWLMEVNSYV